MSAGIALSFFSGIYGAMLGFTLRFKDAKKLVGLSGLFVGCGEILGTYILILLKIQYIFFQCFIICEFH